MSVFPAFVQHIQDLGIYVDGYNYEEMYNIMVNNLINNFIPSQQFIHTYSQVEHLYELLDELLNSNEIDNNSNDVEIIETNYTPQNQDEDEGEWTDQEEDPGDNVNIINVLDPNQNIQYYYNLQNETYNQNQPQTQAEQQLIHYLNNLNNMNNHIL